MTNEELDTHLDAILRASGSALRHYTMHKTCEDMRKALQAAIVAAAPPAAGGERERAGRCSGCDGQGRCAGKDRCDQ